MRFKNFLFLIILLCTFTVNANNETLNFERLYSNYIALATGKINNPLYGDYKTNRASRVAIFANTYLNYPYGDVQEDLCFNCEADAINYLKSGDDFSYSLCKFNCMTFLETLFAVSFAYEQVELPRTEFCPCLYKDKFKSALELNLRGVEYKTATTPSLFINKNHFVSLNWGFENRFVSNITINLFGNSVDFPKKPIMYEDFILKHKFFRDYSCHESFRKSVNEILLDNKLPIEQVPVIPFIYLHKINSEYGSAAGFLNTNLTDPVVIAICSPDKDLIDEIGSYIDVIHLGLYLPKEKKFIHASSVEGKVVKVNLDEYLSSMQQKLSAKGQKLALTIYKIR